MKDYKTFKEFYPFYLSQHEDKRCRLMHFIGSLIVLITLRYALAHQEYWYLLLCPIAGYGFAWVGHFVFEKNRPATFTYPLYSFMGDWVMFKDIIIGKIKVF